MNCVKCGRPIPDGEIFCEACASKPLRPAQRELQSQPGGRHLAPKAASKRRSGASTVALIVMTVITLISIGGAIYCYSTLATQRAGLRAEEADLEAKALSLEAQTQELADTRTELESAQSALAELREKIAALEEEIRGSESDLSQNKYDLDATLKELESLQTERDTLTEQCTALQEQVDTLTAESAELTAKLESAQSDYDALKAKYNTMADKMGWVDTYVVYVENDGTNYYHCYECSSFKKQSFWVYNRKLAENKGFTACPVCGG